MSTPATSLEAWLRARGDEDRQHHLIRRTDPLPDGVVSFGRNDYLGLSRHPDVLAAAHAALDAYGTGMRAARTLGGTTDLHSQLEEELAAWKQTGASLLFPSGYAAAIGTIPALVGPEAVVILDKQIHACLLDGAKLSRATVRVFPHNDMNALDDLLRSARASTTGPVLVVVESLYSMDGDFAPLTTLVDLKDRYGAWLMVDEAHATGWHGPDRSGCIAALGLTPRVEIQMGTLGKTLGSSGGFIAGSEPLIAHLRNRARSHLFTTAAGATSIAAARTALTLVRGPEGANRTALLHARMEKFWRMLPHLPATAGSPIVPVAVESPEQALDFSTRLLEEGLHVPAIRYPTVPRRASRLRISFSADHSEADIDQLTSAIRLLGIA